VAVVSSLDGVGFLTLWDLGDGSAAGPWSAWPECQHDSANAACALLE
jgi:hypothetical protein